MSKRWFVPSPAVCLWLAAAGAAGQETSFLRGDANADGRVSISDPLMVNRFLFLHELPPPCLDAGDVDDDEDLDISDATQLLASVFLGKDLIQAPFPLPAPDPTPAGPEPAPAVLDCGSYEVEPVPATGDLLRIGDVTAAPGAEVEIPVFLSSTVEVDAVQLVVRYEPAVFIPLKSERGSRVSPLSFDGTPWSAPRGSEFRSITVLDGEGIFLVGAIGSLTGAVHPAPGGTWGDPPFPPYPPIPPGDDLLIFKIRGRVAADARDGTVVPLEPTNGPGGEGVHPPYLLRNEITSRGEARYVSFLPRTAPGELHIVADITFFTRGDANSDRTVDIADAVAILGFLYLGSAAPRCMDAADADDSGVIDLTDALAVLGRLFLGADAIAPPYPGVGADTTPDSLAACPR